MGYGHRAMGYGLWAILTFLITAIVPQRFTCEKSVLAIGTNDAMYDITDDQFVSNLKEAIA